MMGGGLPDLIFGSLVVSLTSSLCYFVGGRGRHSVSPTTTTLKLLLHFVSALESAVLALEVNYIVWDNYPVWIYMGAIFLFSLYQATLPDGDEGDYGNPVDTLRSWLSKRVSLWRALLYIVVQVGGASSAYPLIVKPLWSHQGQLPLSLGHLHLDTIKSSLWPTSVYEPDPGLSALSEALVTCGMALVTTSFQQLFERGWSPQLLGGVALNTILYSGGAPWSGAFYNPAVATPLELGLTTSTSPPSTKVWIYWVAPLFGISLATSIQSFIFKTPTPPTTTTTTTTTPQHNQDREIKKHQPQPPLSASSSNQKDHKPHSN